jgi:hypothetical protein
LPGTRDGTALVSVPQFSVVGARVEPYAAAPQLVLRLRVVDPSGAQVHALALNVQVRIEPQRRRYEPEESELLRDLFGEPERYGSTLRSLLWTHVSQMVLAFAGETEFDLPVACSYDFEVAAHKYLSALRDGEIPLELLLRGTLFAQGEGGITAALLPWECEARYRLPVALWRAAMDAFFPNGAWLRVGRDVFEELRRFKTARGLPTWDAALTQLCEEAKIER